MADIPRIALILTRLQSYHSVYGYVSQFIQNDFLRPVFSFHSQQVGGKLFDTTSSYVVIHCLERE
jgi:phytoene desaturase